MANLRAGTTVGGDAVFTVGNISSYGLNFLNGNIGIGTDSPDFLLDLEQKDGGVQLQMGRTNTSAGSAWMGADSTGFHLGVGTYAGIQNSAFTIDSNGNVGIGTTGPLHKLHVAEGNDGAMSVGGSHDIYGLQFSYDQASATESTIRANTDYDNDATLLKISTNNNTNQLVLKGDGNVGIGTTSPDQILTTRPTQVGKYGVHVIKPETNDSLGGIFVETDGTSSLYLKDRDSADISTVRIKAKGDSYFAGGNVGIGTTDTVSYRLNVNGSTNVQGSLYTNALYDNGNANVHAGNIATYLPDHNHNASEITAGTLSSARIPAATADNLGGVKVSYNAASQTLNITTS